MSKSNGIDLAVWLGFSEELKKLAMSSPVSPGDVRKSVSAQGTALATKKPNYAKVNKEPAAPASTSDLAASPKSIQPPPVTMPRGDL